MLNHRLCRDDFRSERFRHSFQARGQHSFRRDHGDGKTAARIAKDAGDGDQVMDSDPDAQRCVAPFGDERGVDMRCATLHQQRGVHRVLRHLKDIVQLITKEQVDVALLLLRDLCHLLEILREEVEQLGVGHDASEICVHSASEHHGRDFGVKSRLNFDNGSDAHRAQLILRAEAVDRAGENARAAKGGFELLLLAAVEEDDERGRDDAGDDGAQHFETLVQGDGAQQIAVGDLAEHDLVLGEEKIDKRVGDVEPVAERDVGEDVDVASEHLVGARVELGLERRIRPRVQMRHGFGAAGRAELRHVAVGGGEHRVHLLEVSVVIAVAIDDASSDRSGKARVRPELDPGASNR